MFMKLKRLRDLCEGMVIGGSSCCQQDTRIWKCSGTLRCWTVLEWLTLHHLSHRTLSHIVVCQSNYEILVVPTGVGSRTIEML